MAGAADHKGLLARGGILRMRDDSSREKHRRRNEKCSKHETPRVCYSDLVGTERSGMKRVPVNGVLLYLLVFLIRPGAAPAHDPIARVTARPLSEVGRGLVHAALQRAGRLHQHMDFMASGRIRDQA